MCRSCWTAANTSSIPGWHVQGARKHGAGVRAGRTRDVPRDSALQLARDKRVPHIPREPSSKRRRLLPLVHLPVTPGGGRAGRLPRPTGNLSPRKQGSHPRVHSSAESPWLTGFATLGKSLHLSGPQYPPLSQADHHRVCLCHCLDWKHENTINWEVNAPGSAH